MSVGPFIIVWEELWPKKIIIIIMERGEGGVLA